MRSIIRSVRPQTFREVLTAAVADFVIHGYDSEQRLRDWLVQLRAAVERDMVPKSQAEREMRDALGSVYQRMVEKDGLLRANPAAGRFTLARVAPRLRQELDRRIAANVQLIKLNRDRAIQETLQRFSGWSTSIPPGGSEVVDRREVKRVVGKSFSSLPYTDRRRMIDQGHKLAASLSDIFAKDGGAIAGVWRQHYTRYPRIEHRKRNGKVYLIRDSWAHERGLVKSGSVGYTDEITQPGEEVSCRCSYEYIYGLSQLPSDMLTQRGRDELERVRAMMDTPRRTAA